MSNLHVLNLAAYEAPEVVEDKKEEWVTYGHSNDYFSFLIERYKNSPTNNAIINNICKFVYGKGLTALDASKKANEYAQMMTLLDSDELKKVILDYKMLGQAAFQVHYSKGRKKIAKVYHIPIQLLAPEKCNQDGKIEAYYYSDNWEDIKKFPPKRIPSFGCSNQEIEILCFKNYTVGMKYFGCVDYVGGLSYTTLEEEISEYLINEVQNSFSGTKLINFNNGVPTEEMQNVISNKVMNKLTGSNGQKIVVAFNSDETNKTTIEDIQLNDAADQYSYLSEECMRKIMLAHNVTSPLLFGIANANGFSSNADELKNSAILFENLVVQPIQNVILDAIKKILAYNGIALKLYFEELQPLTAQGDLTKTDEAEDIINGINSLSPLVANKVLENMTPEEIRSIIGLKGEYKKPDGFNLSKEQKELDLEAAKKLSKLGHNVPDNWVLIDKSEVDYDNEDELDSIIEKANKPKSKLSKAFNFISTGVARPNAKSRQDIEVDGVKFFTRYRYSGPIKDNTRKFCRDMINADKIYRKEDIMQMRLKSVNPGWGPKGADNYSVWLYKGGGSCGHTWSREVYAQFENVPGLNIKDPRVKPAAIDSSIKRLEKYGYYTNRGKMMNGDQVAQRPRDMKNRGFLEPKDFKTPIT